MKLHPKSISIKDYCYELPETKIAFFPLEERDLSKLLVYKNGIISEKVFNQLPDLIPASSLLIFNNTKVVLARIIFEKLSGSKIECFCLKPGYNLSHELAFASTSSSVWYCMVGNSKRWKEDILIKPINVNGKQIDFKARRLEANGQESLIEFFWDDSTISFSEIMDVAGLLPLPPYIKRDAKANELSRYNTVYAKEDGSVAAPTAGLHFTPEVLNLLSDKKIESCYLTLHVGAGTFKPVKADKMEDHEMHSEWMSIDLNSIKHVHSKLGKAEIITVGTTATRSIESTYWWGYLLLENKNSLKNGFEISQWLPYDVDDSALPTPASAFEAVINWMEENGFDELAGPTQIIISPGYKYKVIDAIITNFHQPESTLLLLVAALIGDDWRKVYQYALENNFRFLSYGDSSLLYKKQN